MNPLIKPKIGLLMGVIVGTFLLLVPPLVARECRPWCPGPNGSRPSTQREPGPRDEVEVKFFYTPDLNEKQLIRPDATITLELVGKVMAQGKTPQELRK